MSSRAPAWFETKYVDGVTHKLQSMGHLLQSTSRPPDRIQGLTVNWKVSGLAEATPRSGANDVVNVMNLDRTLVSATMQDWEANDYIDMYDLTKMSENEQAETQKSGGMAIGRRCDKIQIGALDTASASVTTIGNGSTAIDPTVVMTARDQIIDIGCGSYEIYCALPTALISQLALYKEFSNSQWAGPDVPLLKQIGARTVWGINFIPLPSSYFKVTVANSVDGWMWVKEAVGLANAMDVRSRIDWIPEKKKWFAANDFSGCGVVILPEGCKRLQYATNIALARPAT